MWKNWFWSFLCYSCTPVSREKGQFKIGHVREQRRQRIVPAQEASQVLRAGTSANKPARLVTAVKLLLGTSSCKRC